MRMCVFVRVRARARARVYVVWFWNRNPSEIKPSVPDRLKQLHVVREMNIFTRLQLAGCVVNDPRLTNSEIKERVQL